MGASGRGGGAAGLRLPNRTWSEPIFGVDMWIYLNYLNSL